MSEDLKRAIKRLEGDGPAEKHIILFKLKEALENSPEFGDRAVFEVNTPQRRWLAEVGALLSRLGIGYRTQFKASYGTLAQYWKPAVNQIQGQVLDAIEDLKLDLELDGRTEFGSAYAPGDVYRFFADLKGIIKNAQKSIMLVDPYFDGSGFDDYLSSAPSTLTVHVLADRYAKDVASYVVKHRAQYGGAIELRTSKELHDRLLLIDDESAWIMGGSIKDAGKKATYLIPLATPIATAKRKIYADIWNRSAQAA